MTPSPDELDRIERLRRLFLDESRGDAPMRDYWRDAGDLEAYASVLAARIGWKWDAALAECRERGMPRADDALVLDFGCGSGVAAQRFAHWFGAREVLCHDRSATAMRFAAGAVAAATGVPARPQPRIDSLAVDVLLVSHVLGELDERGVEDLRGAMLRARRVIVLEPGNHATSRRLGALRDGLLASCRVIAPCPHAAACPALATAGDWCHFFAPPPPHVFTDGEWVVTARRLGIDLRALPYCFLALERSPTGSVATPPAAHRLLGRPIVGRHEVTVRLCTADGVVQASIDKRSQPAAFRALRNKGETLRTLPAMDPSS